MCVCVCRARRCVHVCSWVVAQAFGIALPGPRSRGSGLGFLSSGPEPMVHCCTAEDAKGNADVLAEQGFASKFRCSQRSVPFGTCCTHSNLKEIAPGGLLVGPEPMPQAACACPVASVFLTRYLHFPWEEAARPFGSFQKSMALT